MLNKQTLYDFIAENEKSRTKLPRLFSFSQQITETDFISIKSKFLNEENFSFYWSIPAEQYSFVSAGEIYSIKKDDLKDLSGVDSLIRNLPFEIISNIKKSDNPFFVGGIKFPSGRPNEVWNDFAFLQWSIPQILCTRNGEDYFLIINSFENDMEKSISQVDSYLSARKQDVQDFSHLLSVRKSIGLDEWSSQVRTALELISQKKIDKVVLSRFNEIKLSSSPDLSFQLEQLETGFENCTIFAYKSGGSIFFGATPEKLFRADNEFIEADALAGSISRGASPDEDKILEDELLHDKKNLAEHKSVVDFIITQLTPVTEKILFDSQPVIKKYSNIQHLYSQIRARLKSGISFFSLLELLYPTPAVCGYPKTEALSIINVIEKFDRGLFAGAVGWFNLEGKAEFSVGIRSALLRKNILLAYAGCGVINGSEPVSEYNEIELKLKPILNLFADETVYKS
ncbi:MAG: isochorismate synthase [Melioribacteraceae bacterium]